MTARLLSATCCILLTWTLPAGAQQYERLYNFDDARLAAFVNGGRGPMAGLVQGLDGNFYGTTETGGSRNFGTIFRLTPTGELKTLSEFTLNVASPKGSYPRAGLTAGPDGRFYGTTSSGGASGNGTVFETDYTGTHFFTLVEFTGNGATNKGSTPDSALTLGDDGNLYGTTTGGGANGHGTIFRLTPSGTLTTLVEFTGSGASNRGRSPNGLVKASDGNFYGTTKFGGLSDSGDPFGFGYGTIFKMTPGGVFTTLVEFTGSSGANRGDLSTCSLVEGEDGKLYGTTLSGGTQDYGTVFEVTFAGVLTTLVHFSHGNGKSPTTGLARGTDGNLYGTTAEGGQQGQGTVFKLTPAGVLTTLVHFTGTSGAARGDSPYGDLLLASDGSFYGTTSQGGVSDDGTIFKISPDGTFTTVLDFVNIKTSDIGTVAEGRLLETADGNFYGTTSEGGTLGYGTVFRFDPARRLTTLVDFKNFSVPFGRKPESPLVRTATGDLYGTTLLGGTTGDSGTIFKLSPAGMLTTLVSFTGSGGAAKGGLPYGGLTLANDGNLYGATASGGSAGRGTVYRLTPQGVLTTLVEFTTTGPNAGSFPTAPLTLAPDGTLYGTTQLGGPGLDGTIFKVTTDGELTTLVEFSGNGATNKGDSPTGALIIGPDGNFYGVTGAGGANSAGTAFKMTPAGTLTTLAQFGGSAGVGPSSGLVLGNDGNFYGHTRSGGANGEGTIYRMTPDGTLSVVWSFSRAVDGQPEGTPILGADGNIYGTTAGTIYRLVMPGRPLLESVQAVTRGGNVVVEAWLNPRGSPTAAVVEYGSDGVNFPHTVPLGTGLTGYQARPVGTTLGGLSPGANYFYRFRATNASGTNVSAVQSFSTLALPSILLADPTEIAQTSARFQGSVDARNFDTTVVFEWGFDGNSFPNAIAAEPGLVAGVGAQGVSRAVAGLVKGQTYYYRIVATNVAGTVVSGSRSFITLTEPAVISIEDAIEVGIATAKVGGVINARGVATAAAFEYGTDGISFPNSLAATPSPTGIADTRVEATLSGLAQGVTYYYRLAASSTGGIAVPSPVKSFTTPALPGIINPEVGSVGSSTAMLRAVVSANQFDTAVVFEYGISPAALSSSAAGSPGMVSGNDIAVSTVIGGLQPETPYYFRVRATSSAGEALTNVLNFTTSPSARAVTGAASNIALDSATVSGTFNAFGQTTAVVFTYGIAPNELNQSVPAGVGTLMGASDTVLTAKIPVETPGIRYYYRAQATNGGGTTIAQNTEFFDVPGNEVPIATPDLFFYAGQVVVDPLENDTDANNVAPTPANAGLKLAPALVVPPNASRGVAVVENQRTISYSPQFNVRDDDSLTYRVIDPQGATADGQVRLIAFSKRAGLYGGRMNFGSEGNAREGQVAVQMGSGGLISTSFMAWPSMGEGVRESFVLKGQFDQRGRLSRTLNSPSGAVLTLTLQLDADQPQMLGTFEERVNDVSTTGVISFVLTKNGGTGGMAESGLRTGFLSPPPELAATMSEGFVRMTIGKDAKRGARFAGRLPDGEPFLASAKAQGRAYELTRKLEQGGLFTGLVRAINGSGMIGDLYWGKRANGRARFHRGGVESMLSLSGVVYPVIARGGLPPLGLGAGSANARVRLSGGDLSGSYRDVLVNIRAGGAVQIVGPDLEQTGTDLKSLNTSKMTIKLNAPQAMFSGKFVHPETGTPVTFEGAFRAPFDTEPAQGRGVFRGPSAAGTVRIEGNAAP